MGRLDGDEINTNTFECPNCGQRVFVEVLVCPKCGLHFYDEEDAENTEAEEIPRPGKGNSLIAIFFGLLVSVAIAFMVNLFASRIWSAQTISPAGRAILFLGGPLGALFGGYLAANMIEGRDIRRVVLQGLAVSVFSLIAAYLLQSYWQNLTTQPVTPLTLGSWTVLLTVGPLGGWLAKQKIDSPLLLEPHNDEKRLYLDLLAYVRHDINTAERLIAYERSRTPTATRVRLIENAIARLERDKR